MRTTPILRTLGVALAACWLADAGQATAQTTASRDEAGVPAPAAAGFANPITPGLGAYASPYANPFTNPYFNPYLNPYMTTVPMSPDLGMLYLLGARSARGGLGSGQISGVRAAERGTDRRQPNSVPPTISRRSRSRSRSRSSRGPARMPRSLARPTAGAERYFGRLPDRGAAAADYYGRSVRRLPQP